MGMEPGWTYILLKDGVKPADLEKNFRILFKNYPPIVKAQVLIIYVLALFIFIRPGL
jgi:hypothetical protein